MPTAYVYDSGRRRILRKTHPHRDAKSGAPLRKTASSGINVRPYLLKRFRPRKTEDMKCINNNMFRQIHSAVLKYTKDVPIPDLPDKLGYVFMEKVNERFADDLEGDCHLSIVTRCGKIHLMISYQPLFGDIDCHLAIGGVQRIEDEYVREATTMFLNAFITNNDMFTLFHSTVWDTICLESDDNENNEELHNAMQLLGDIAIEKDALLYQFNLIKKEKPLDRDSLMTLLKNTHAKNTRDGALIDLLREGVPYAFEKRWTTDDAEDYRSTNAYSNVLVSPGDYFPITLKENPIQMGYDIIREYWDGDSTDSPPSRFCILENDGTLTDLYDRDGFETFTNKLTRTLNSYYNA